MLRYVRCCCALALALLLCALFGGRVTAASADGPTFSLRPAHSDPARPATKGYFISDAAPGRAIEDEVVVRNSGTVAGTVRLFAVDAMTGQNGGSDFPSEADPRRDVGNWICIGRTELTLQPDEEQTVAFTITIPDDATAGQHLGGLVALDTVIKQGNPGTLRIDTQTRMVTAVQVNLPGPTIEQMTVGGVSVSGPEGTQVIWLDLRNDGNTMVKPVGTLIVTDATGAKVQDLPLKLDTFVPHTAIPYPVAVQKRALGAGRYHAKVELTYGTSGVTSYEGDFSITAAQVAQVFPSAAPALAPPPVAADGASAAPATTSTTAPAQWPLFAGGAVLLVLALAGGVFLGRRGRAGGVAK